MAWETSDWNNHEESKDAWKILKHHTEVASNRIYEELPEILQHSFDEGVAHAREQIAREVKGAEIEKIIKETLAAQFTGHGWAEDYQAMKTNKLWMLISERVAAAIARGEK